MSTVAQPEVANPTRLMTGDFVWYELRTTDSKAAEDFYTHVVGWNALPFGDPGSGMPYTILNAGSSGVAGLMQLTPEMQADGMTPSWAGFVGVDDVDAYVRRIEEAGGKLQAPPQDIPNVGRFAAMLDPQGAEFLLFKGTQHQEPPPRLPMGTPGTVGWHELSANDGAAAWEFYAQIFPWKVDHEMDMGPMGVYRIFNNNGGMQMGGMMTRDQSKAPAPFWLFYIAVEDIDAAVTRIGEKSGQVCMGPHEVPGGSFIVIGTDVQGAMFALVGPRKK